MDGQKNEPMSDLIERLREWADGCGSTGIKGDAREMALANVLTEAADALARVTDEVDRLAQKRVTDPAAVASIRAVAAGEQTEEADRG